MKKHHTRRHNYRSEKVFAVRSRYCAQQAREDKNLSIRALAHRLELSATFVSQVERGLTASVAPLYVLATELEISVDDVFSSISQKLFAGR
jgi:transcriptional regulator with XRE-family HTH domain